MKNLITLFQKLFGQKMSKADLNDSDLDAWIMSIREKPQYSHISCTVEAPKQEANNNDDREASSNLVLA